MPKETSISSLFERSFIGSILLMVVYIKFGPPKYVETESVNFVIHLFILPIIFIGLTMGFCLIAGLSLFLIPKLKRWWDTYPYIAFVGLLVGIFMILCSPYFGAPVKVREIDFVVQKQIFDFNLFVIGWFMTAFFMLHFNISAFIEIVFKRKKNNLNWGNEL